MIEHVLDNFSASVALAFRREPAIVALESSGWISLLADGAGDAAWIAGVLAPFLAAGRTLTASPAGSLLTARPFVEAAASLPSGLVGSAVVVEESAGHIVAAVPVSPAVRYFVVDRPGAGAYLVDRGSARASNRECIDEELVQMVDFDLTRTPVMLDEDAAAAVRGTAVAWSRLGAAFEILGLCESLVDLGVEHAKQRQQFGQPLASFQAVRHMLAWGALHTDAIRQTCLSTLRMVEEDGAACSESALCYAAAAQNGKRVCDYVAQVLGAISFTAEHPYQAHQRRIATLRVLHGRLNELYVELAQAYRSAAFPGLFAIDRHFGLISADTDG